MRYDDQSQDCDHCIGDFAGSGFLGAYEWHLSSTAVREAYFLGRNNDHRTTEFLAKYVHQFPLPKTGPQIAEIEVVTPYAYVVKRAREALDYSAQQAQKDFLNRAPKFSVRVRINITPSYPAVIIERILLAAKPVYLLGPSASLPVRPWLHPCRERLAGRSESGD